MIGILFHPKIPRALPMAENISGWLEARGKTVWRESVESAENLTPQIADSSLILALGGDGTVLRCVRATAPLQVPVFSINLGKLGFLTEATPDNWQQRLSVVLAGKHRIERRLMLRAIIEREGVQIAELTALNEIVLGRGRQVQIVRFQLFVGGNLVEAYAADSLITATPTGSTAYALAAGGPIMPPELPNFMVVPVAPHLSLDRAIILHEDAEVGIRPIFHHKALATADGQHAVDLQTRDMVRIRRAEHDGLFVRID
ncbi:MAG TPA: NAD(+)/NADH kinase, partial [Anaerolineae bacterium]|nr:NAD(+)/NADH kinase [Anaerolineae bacterium]